MNNDMSFAPRIVGFASQNSAVRLDHDSVCGPATIISIRGMMLQPAASSNRPARNVEAFAGSKITSQIPNTQGNRARTGSGSQGAVLTDSRRDVGSAGLNADQVNATRLSVVPPTSVVRAVRDGNIRYAMAQMLSLGMDEITAENILRDLSRILARSPRASQGAAAYGATTQNYEFGGCEGDRYDTMA